MTTSKDLKCFDFLSQRLVIIVLICNATDPVLTSMYSGSWCPYQVHKSVPCRVQNGTEPYLGPNLCWTSTNGSYVCTKRIQYRPKFVTSYKKVWETRYKCCPGLEGPECQNECFNCSKFHDMESRLVDFEAKLRQFRSSAAAREDVTATTPVDSRWPLSNTIEHPQLISTSKNEVIELEIRLAALSTNFRELDDRLRSVETQLLQLIRSVDDLSETLAKKADITGNLKDNLVSTSSSTLRHTLAHRENSNQAAKVKSHARPHSYNYNGISDYNQYSLSTQSLIAADLNNSDLPTPSSETILWSVQEQSTSEPLPVHNHKDIINAISKSSADEYEKLKDRNKQKQQISSVKKLEENLERGDIASTLNDDEDYEDEEILSKKDFNAEDYSDQLLETLYDASK